eukprot:sb/3475373/
MVKHPVGGTTMSMTSTLRVLTMNTVCFVYLAVSIASMVVATDISEHSEDWDQLVKVVQEESTGDVAVQFAAWVVMPPLTSLLDAVVYLAFSREARVWRLRGRNAGAVGNQQLQPTSTGIGAMGTTAL